MEQLDLLAGEFVEAVSKLKLEDGGDILVVGSRTLVHTLMEFDRSCDRARLRPWTPRPGRSRPRSPKPPR